MISRALALVIALGCKREHIDPPDVSPLPSASLAHVDVAVSTALMRDEEVGPLIAKLSETPGDFPSDNYVTNETSLLDVAPALRNPALKRRAYVGVGPEQNLTYLALLEPTVAFIVDIRRGNLLEFMVFRGCFEASPTRAEFLTALLARRATIDPGFAAFLAAPPDRALRDAAVARTTALLARLHVVHAKGDDDDIARIHDAFFTRGLLLAYTMKGSFRKYPTLAENFMAKDPSGVESTFLASDEAYARVRRMVLDNRVIPVVGDFGGKHALRSLGEDMHARGLLLGAFYTSNVEQYLFDDHTYGEFVASVASMPRDDASVIVRVWFDQGRAHPAQRPGHRTTQLVFGANAFVERAQKKPFASYWEVVNQTP